MGPWSVAALNMLVDDVLDEHGHAVAQPWYRGRPVLVTTASEGRPKGVAANVAVIEQVPPQYLNNAIAAPKVAQTKNRLSVSSALVTVEIRSLMPHTIAACRFQCVNRENYAQPRFRRLMSG